MGGVNRLHSMQIDEVSLVDIPANQHASVEIAKRAPEENPMPQQNEGLADDVVEEISLDEAMPGDIIELENGEIVALTAEDIEALQDAAEEHANAQVVGKAFTPPSSVGGLAEQVRVELSKAFSQEGEQAAIAKMADRIVWAESQANEAITVAKALADRNLEGKYTEIAKSWDIPGVDPGELGPVIKRLADVMSEDDQLVIAKALRSAGDTFREIGAGGMASMGDPMDAIGQYVQTDGNVSKALEGLTREQQVSKAFEMNPAAYDAYIFDQNA